MTARTTARHTVARRTAVLTLGAVGALALATPASALDVGGVVGQVAPPLAPVAELLGPLTSPVVDPLVTPLEPVVTEVVATVEAIVGGAPQSPGPASPGAPQPVPGPAGPEAAGGPQPPAPAAAPDGPAGAADAAAAGSVTAASVGGTGFAASPGSIAALERTGLTGGSGTAANPMSLFGAPQVALPPAVEVGAVASPQVFTPAGGALPDLIPVAPLQTVPGYLAALAATVVAGAAAAHVAALRSRRTGAVA